MEEEEEDDLSFTQREGLQRWIVGAVSFLLPNPVQRTDRNVETIEGMGESQTTTYSLWGLRSKVVHYIGNRALV